MSDQHDENEQPKPIIWYTIVDDHYGFATIRVAKAGDERVSSSFEDLKKDLTEVIKGRLADLMRQINEVQLNLQSVSVLRIEDTTKPVGDSRSMH